MNSNFSSFGSLVDQLTACTNGDRVISAVPFITESRPAPQVRANEGLTELGFAKTSQLKLTEEIDLSLSQSL